MDLTTFNRLDDRDAVAVLAACCGSGVWVDRMLAARPYRDSTELLATAEQVWWDLGADDWQEAFAAHRTEQARPEYEARFGYPYVAHDQDRDPADSDEAYRARLDNDPLTELRATAAEQARITNRSLRTVLDLG